MEEGTIIVSAASHLPTLRDFQLFLIWVTIFKNNYVECYVKELLLFIMTLILDYPVSDYRHGESVLINFDSLPSESGKHVPYQLCQNECNNNGFINCYGDWRLCFPLSPGDLIEGIVGSSSSKEILSHLVSCKELL